jgi:lipooligosaccharide transport system permease protein
MTVLARVAAPFTFGSRRAGRLIERNLLVYRRSYLTLASGFFEPLFYLLAMGFGLGTLVGTVPGLDGRPLSYTAFIAPALLAASSANGAIYESTNVMFRLNYEKVYNAVLVTPMSVGDIALGELGWALTRGALYSTGFTAVLVLFGLMPSAWGLLALPASLLIGFAAGGLGMAAVTFMKSWQDLDLIQMAVLPIFLLSGTFFPVSAYPPVFQAVVQLSPLYRGTDLLRGLTTGVIGPVAIVDVVYLLALGLIGLAIVRRRLHRLLLK